MSPTLGCSTWAEHTHQSQFGQLKPTCDTHIILLYARAPIAWTKKKPKKCSLRNEKLKENRASETEELRNERLRIRREKDREPKNYKRGKEKVVETEDHKKKIEH